MKNSNLVSAVIGSAFFAVPLLATPIGLPVSLAIGVAAFGASELILRRWQEKSRTSYK